MRGDNDFFRFCNHVAAAQNFYYCLMWRKENQWVIGVCSDTKIGNVTVSSAIVSQIGVVIFII